MGDDDVYTGVCDDCDRIFLTVEKLTAHKIAEHDNDQASFTDSGDDSDEEAPVCDICSEKFDSFAKLSEHKAEKHELKKKKKKAGPASRVRKEECSDSEEEEASAVRRKPGPKSKTTPQASSDEEQSKPHHKPGPKSKTTPLPSSDEEQSKPHHKPGPKSQVQKPAESSEDSDCKNIKKKASDDSSSEDSDVDAFMKARVPTPENDETKNAGAHDQKESKPNKDSSSDDSDVDTFKKEVKKDPVREDVVVKHSSKEKVDDIKSKDERRDSKDEKSKDHKKHKKHKHKSDEKERSKHKSDEKEKSKEHEKEKSKEHKKKQKERDKERSKDKPKEHKEKTSEVQKRPASSESASVPKKIKVNSDDSTDDEARNKSMAENAKKSWKETSDFKSGKLSSASRSVSIDTDSFLASDDEDSSKSKKKSSIGLKDLFKKTSPSKSEKRKRDSDSDDDDTPVIKKKKEKDPNRTYFTSKGSVNVTGDADGPACFKCDQVCKDKSQLKNHVLSHFYDEFYKVLPSSKPYPCPECQHENRDRITLVRHYAFTHRKIFEYVTEDQLGMNANAPMRKPKTPGNKPKMPKEPKEAKYKNYLDSMKSKGIIESSSDEDVPKKSKGPEGPLISQKTYDKPGEHKKHKKEKKHKKHKEHKHDREHKEHKKHKKDKKEKRDKERHERKSTDVKSPLSHMLKEMTPSSDNSQSKIVGDSWSGEPEPEDDDEFNLPCPVMAVGDPFTPAVSRRPSTPSGSPPPSGRPSTPPGSPPQSEDNSTPLHDEKEDPPTNTNQDASETSEDEFDLPAPVFAM